MNTAEQYALITRRLAELNGASCERLRQLLSEGKSPSFLWSHIGYFIPLIKFADFVRAGGEVVLEVVDSYAFLVNYKYPWDQVRHRTIYYRSLITAVLNAIGVPMSKVTMVDQSSYQGKPKYLLDFWKMCTLCSQQDLRSTGQEVGAATMMSPMLTPLVQELALEHLGADVELGGIDQRGTFDLGQRCLPQLGFSPRAHFMNTLLPSLTGGKMSSSHPAHTKIMFLDNPAEVRAKIASASCPARSTQDNGVLPIAEHIIFPISEIWAYNSGRAFEGVRPRHSYHRRAFVADGAPAGTLFSIKTSEASNPQAYYRNFSAYQYLERDYVAGAVQPENLKEAVAKALNMLLEEIRSDYEQSEDWVSSDWIGYPEDWSGPQDRR